MSKNCKSTFQKPTFLFSDEPTDPVPSKRSRSSPSRSYDPQGMDHRSTVIRSEYPIPEQCVGLGE